MDPQRAESGDITREKTISAG
ncbi:hypothetical protein [Salinibacter ruber]